MELHVTYYKSVVVGKDRKINQHGNDLLSESSPQGPREGAVMLDK